MGAARKENRKTTSRFPIDSAKRLCYAGNASRAAGVTFRGLLLFPFYSTDEREPLCRLSLFHEDVDSGPQGFLMD